MTRVLIIGVVSPATFHMLHSLDVLIGFAAIMLLLSAAVTMLTQAVTGALGWRGRNLVRGLVTILNQVDPKIASFCAQQIALGVVQHPLIARPKVSREGDPARGTDAQGTFL